MAKKASLKLLAYFLLANFFVFTQLSLAETGENQKTASSAETENKTTEENQTKNRTESESTPDEEKPNITDDIAKNIDIKQTANKAFYYSVGSTSAAISIASFCGLYFLFKKLNEMKKSYIKNFLFKFSKKAILYFENKSQYDRYMIPGAIFGLAANGILTSIMAAWMLRAGYKA